MKIEYFETTRKRDFAEILENFLFLKTFPGCWACSQFVYLNSNKKEAAGKKNSLNSILSNYCLSKHTNFIDLIVTLIQRRSS